MTSFLFAASSAAWAGVALVPMPPLIADGATTGVVRLLVDDPKRIRVKAATGEVGAVEIGDGGLVSVRYTPASAEVAGEVELTVTEAGAEHAVQVPIMPDFDGAFRITFDLPSVPAGTPATVRITAEDPGPVAANARQLVLAASLGTLGAPVPAGAQEWTATWTPPKGIALPTWVVVTAYDPSAPTTLQGYGALPVTVHRTVPFTATPGTANLLHLGEQQVGPVLAPPSGKISFEIDHDPRVPAGFITTVDTSGTKTDKAVMLPGAPAGLASFLATPPAVPLGQEIEVRLLVLGPTGEPKKDATPVVTASIGTVGAVERDGDEYVLKVTAPTVAGELKLTADVGGLKAERRIKVQAAPLGVAPARVIVWPASPKVAVGGIVPVTVVAVDAWGRPLPGVEVALTAAGGTVPPTAKTDPRGLATVTFQAGAEADLAAVHATAGGLSADGPIVVGDGPLLPVGGPPDVEALLVKLHGVLPAAKPVAGGAPASLQVAGVPAFFEAGVPVLATVRVTDAGGVGVGGQTLAVVPSAGAASPVIERGAGVYTFVVTPNADASELTVHVGTGAANGALVVRPASAAPLPVEDAPVAAAGTTRAPRAGKTRAPRSPSAAPEREPLRLGIVILDQHATYAQTGEEVGGLMGDVTFATPAIGFVGGRVDASMYPLVGAWGAVGGEVRVAGQLDLMNVRGTGFTRVPFEASLGARYGYDLGPVRLGVLVGGQVLAGRVFAYADEANTVPGLISDPRVGLRVGPAVRITAGELIVDVEGAQTFAADFANTHAEVVVEVPLAKVIGLRAGVSGDLRSGSYLQTTPAIAQADLERKQLGVLIGVGF